MADFSTLAAQREDVEQEVELGGPAPEDGDRVRSFCQ